MKTLQFPVTVSNHSPNPVNSVWSVRLLKRSAFKGDPVIAALPAKPVDIKSFGLVKIRPNELMCRKDISPHEKLELKLAARSSQTVALVVDLAKPLDPSLPQTTLFALEEVRSDGATGGVVVAVCSVTGTLAIQPIDLAPRPSPLSIVGAPSLQSVEYFCKQIGSTQLDRLTGTAYLGVLLRNDDSLPLKDVVLYLECLGIAGAQWESRVYEMNELAPGEHFFAVFPVDLSNAELGQGGITLLAYDANHDRTRLRVEVSVFDSSKR